MLDGVFLSVLNRSITAGIVILVVFLVRFLLKKAPKMFSYALWAVVLFRLICPFSFESVIGLLPMNKTPISQDIGYQAHPQIDTGIQGIDNSINSILPAPPETMTSVNPMQIWIAVGSCIWLMGMAVMLSYSIIQYVRLKRKLVGATPLRDRIYLADHISTPFVMGVIKPDIFLPSSMAETEQGFIIAHEQYHIRRLDHIARILGFAALTLHWFNPLVWLAFLLSGRDMEMSCDEAVMKRMDTDIRAEYAQALLRFAAGRSIAPTPLAFGEGDTKGRVQNVMKYKKPALWVSVTAVIAVICIGVGLMGNHKTEQMSKETGSVSMGNLWENRTEYVGNNSAVGNILLELSFPDNMQYKNFELKTKEKPYEIIVHFEGINDIFESVDDDGERTETILNTDLKQMEENARIMFSLIGNVEKITFSVNRKAGGTFQNQYIRNEYEELFAKTVSYEGFQRVLAGILDTRNTDSPADDKAPGTGAEKDKIHEQAVVSALTSAGSRYLEGECFAEGHIILGYDDSDETRTKIYALTMFGWYGFENNNFVKVSGSGVIPAVITLDNDNHVEIEYPKDGGDYKVSIENMFPAEYHSRIWDSNDNSSSDREELSRQEHQYAAEYLSKIGRDAKISDTADFAYTPLTHAGISVDVSNELLENFYKQHSDYPHFIGTRERLEHGVRMVYEMSYEKNQEEIKFIKYEYDTKEIIEQFTVDAKTGLYRAQ